MADGDRVATLRVGVRVLDLVGVRVRVGGAVRVTVGAADVVALALALGLAVAVAVPSEEDDAVAVIGAVPACGVFVGVDEPAGVDGVVPDAVDEPDGAVVGVGAPDGVA